MMRAAPSFPRVDLLPAMYQMPSSHFSSGGSDAPDQSLVNTEGVPEKRVDRPRALVVDDAPDVTEMIAMFLRHAGFDAVMAFSAAEALEAARAEQFEVIVSDIGMPGMNGYDLAVALRALPEYSSVPMIAVTGFSMYDDKGRALASGFNAHMTKPINPMSLLDLIKSLRD
ncbi:MAG TPA: response regulator [Pyrinomonadaceae bacterium]|nr:response regulator [Pyrinomonadaceae bacterium]